MGNTLNIGFVGGGQLAMMTALEAKKISDYDFRINILDPSADCPAHRFASEHIIGDFKDPTAIRSLAEISDIITYEIELGDAKSLMELRDEGTEIHPSPETLEIIQDKVIQKKFLDQNGIKVPNFVEVSNKEEIHRAVQDLGIPCLLKSRRDAYDGRGNFVIRRKEEIDMAHERFIGKPVMVEEFIDFEKEVSIVAAKGQNEVAAYPAGENQHEEGILIMTRMPAQISKEVEREAENVARRTLEAFNDQGVFGIEMFVVDGKILVNEVAPRVHNTGHGTLEKSAFVASQFEQHLRAISGAPLRGTEIREPVVMQNILGSKDSFVGPYTILGTKEVNLLPGVHLYLYGKKEVRPLRKLGHLSVVGNEYEKADVEGTSDLLSEESNMDVLVRRARTAHSMLKVVPVQEHGS